MKKRMNKVWAILMITALLVTFAAVNVYADAAYTPVSGTTTTFKKFLILEDGSAVPNVTFNFTIAAGTAVDATATTAAVIPGPVVEEGGVVTAPTVGSATFAPGNTTYTTVQTGDIAVSEGLGTGDQYAKQEVTATFTGVSFSKPGVYRYAVTETAPSAPSAVVGDATRYLDVYVTDNDGTLVVSSYVLHTGSDAPALISAQEGTTGTVANKTDGFANRYSTKAVTFDKVIAGNQGDKTKLFTFTVKAVGTLNAADLFPVTLADGAVCAALTDGALTGAQLNEGVTFQLTNTSDVSIDLPANAQVVITEAYEDYTASLSGLTNAAANETQTAAAFGVTTSGDEDANATFTNTKQGVIPTGVLLTIAPFAIGVLIFGAVMFFIIGKKRREDY